MKTYFIDVQLAATLYIRAETLEEAQAKLEAFELFEDIRNDVDGDMFDDLPEDPKLSPAMTYVGPYPDQTIQEA